MKTLIVFLNIFLWTVIFGAVFLIAPYLFFLWAITGFNPYFLEIDSCVDFGGGWNDELNICEYEE
ncbi:MAG: hypothetical protein KA099_03015 [Alphaproteobacteria bacterium]|nr:hypothetical protein [Alphaproteobacteria bacterium]MBP7759313.1 hypothetical protein [Alphaproteobacteria bacterium]MBP7762526.1 hypothetical protein [Alphaproteobacteria bacterium]MBP7904273.1 hypothetical protein [Alphaproteobacteria bacterium]